MLIEGDVITLPSIHPLTMRTAKNHRRSQSAKMPKTFFFPAREFEGKSACLWHDVTRPEKVRRLNVTAKRTAAMVASLWPTPTL